MEKMFSLVLLTGFGSVNTAKFAAPDGTVAHCDESPPPITWFVFLYQNRKRFFSPSKNTSHDINIVYLPISSNNVAVAS